MQNKVTETISSKLILIYLVSAIHTLLHFLSRQEIQPQINKEKLRKVLYTLIPGFL